jgi:DtxR family Mn-dependent transcriptional regulator
MSVYFLYLLADTQKLDSMLSKTEENYLKVLFKITTENGQHEAGTNEIASLLEVKPASVNSMLKKLKEKKLVDFERYGKITLTEDGSLNALRIVRKHRLWETFLCQKMEFSWDEVHEVAEQLEHIHSEKLIDQLDKLLGFPSTDPHGEPIPNKHGVISAPTTITLLEANIGTTYTMVGVKDDSKTFLQYIEKMNLGINAKLKVISKQDFDNQIEIEVDGESKMVSEKFADHIYLS